MPCQIFGCSSRASDASGQLFHSRYVGISNGLKHERYSFTSSEHRIAQFPLIHSCHLATLNVGHSVQQRDHENPRTGYKSPPLAVRPKSHNFRLQQQVSAAIEDDGKYANPRRFDGKTQLNELMRWRRKGQQVCPKVAGKLFKFCPQNVVIA